MASHLSKISSMSIIEWKQHLGQNPTPKLAKQYFRLFEQNVQKEMISSSKQLEPFYAEKAFSRGVSSIIWKIQFDVPKMSSPSPVFAEMMLYERLRVLSIENTSAIEIPPEAQQAQPAEHPSFFSRIRDKISWHFYNFLILLLLPINACIKLLHKVNNLFIPKNPSVEKIRNQLKEFIRNSDEHYYERLSNENAMNEILEHLPKESQELFLDFISIEEFRPHLREILCGANVKLVNQGDYFFEKWKNNSNSYSRVSSHQYQPGTCFGIKGKIIREITFWKDLDGCLRFQFESRPAKLQGLQSVIEMFLHLGDYLYYKRDNRQQSQFGTSKYTENNCLEIELDMDRFYQQRSSY